MFQPLEDMLSPIIINRRTAAVQGKNNLITDDDIILIEKIKKQKYDVINGRISPAEVDLVRPEIVDSWIRSHQYGHDIFKINEAPTLSNKDYDRLLKEKEQLVRVADSYIRQLKNMLYRIDCVIGLTDEKGVVLTMLEGQDNNIHEANHMRPGVIWTEKSIGTCSHSLCTDLESPIQICGPEHYCDSFNLTTASSAPIFDMSRNLIGTLTIASSTLQNMSEHTLGFAVSMAWAIQNELRLTGGADELFYATLEAYKDAVITINSMGQITKANKIAHTLLNAVGKLQGHKIFDILGNQPVIKSVLETGISVTDAQNPIEIQNLRLNLHSIQAVKNKYDKLIGCVINLRKIDRPKKIISTNTAEKTGFLFDDIIGSSPQMIKIIETTKKFAHIDANILIQGDSGTGKEVFAQAIHNERRPEGPFMVLNCAAIPKNLIESELFGYEGGAFTGAERQGRPGKIEMANKGTLFLDEIGDMPMELQPVLLRVLEEKKIIRVGGNRYIPIDFNLVAATNKDLLELVKNNLFREDLYYRLAVFKALIPPLRDRGPDIIRLAKYIINNIAIRQQISAPCLSEEVKNVMIQYTWPGNVRQLENAMLFAVNMCKEGVITLEDIPEEIRGFLPAVPGETSPHKENTAAKHDKHAGDSSLSIRELEKIAIIQALNQKGNTIGEAAKMLGFSKTTMYRKIREYEIDVPVRTKNP